MARDLPQSTFISSENFTGLVLALLSSIFIGASFILKKKGLKRAGVSGVRAGIRTSLVGRHAYNDYWRSCKFCCLCIRTCGVGNPPGCSQYHCEEKLHALGVLGCIICMVGSVTIVIHAPQERSITSVKNVWELATQPAFLFYTAFVAALVLVLVFHFAPRCGHTHVMVYVGICSLMGSLSVMSVKALGIAIKLTFEGENQFVYSQTWFFVMVVAICVLTQMNYLNKALDTFNTAVVSPIYYVMFTSLTILASIIMFKDWDGQSAAKIVSEICGFVTTLSGTVLLHATKDLGDSRISGMSMYSALSPSLSARLNNGVIDTKNQEYDEGLPVDIPLRRQELFLSP